MDCVVPFIYQHLDYAPWIIWGSLMLAGLNFPISEDLMLITAGVLAATIMPEHVVQLFLSAFLGCYLSDWVAYWLGRILGLRVLQIRWFRRIASKVCVAENFYDRYGVYALFIGRFIPFGVRNLLFITAGMGKMHFGKFMISDGFACLISNITLFYLAYSCGKNYDVLRGCIGLWHIFAIVMASLSVVVFVVMYKKLKPLGKEVS